VTDTLCSGAQQFDSSVFSFQIALYSTCSLSTMARATRTSTKSVKSPPKKKEAALVKAKKPVAKKISSTTSQKAGVVVSIEACKQ
jgi:hypothetical protein